MHRNKWLKNIQLFKLISVSIPRVVPSQYHDSSQILEDKPVRALTCIYYIIYYNTYIRSNVYYDVMMLLYVIIRKIYYAVSAIKFFNQSSLYISSIPTRTENQASLNVTVIFFQNHRPWAIKSFPDIETGEINVQSDTKLCHASRKSASARGACFKLAPCGMTTTTSVGAYL